MNKKFQQSVKKQRGAVLALTLILLVVISFVAISTLKNSISGEQISKNMRTNVMALQSAETALRLCEDAVRTGTNAIDGVAFSKLPIPENLAAGSPPISWKTRANWAPDQGLTTLIPTTQTVVAGMRPVPRPRCMVEQYRLPRLDPDSTLSDPYLVTAVGYSPDYQANSNGDGVAGSEVWVQTIFRP